MFLEFALVILPKNIYDCFEIPKRSFFPDDF